MNRNKQNESGSVKDWLLVAIIVLLVILVASLGADKLPSDERNLWFETEYEHL